MAKKLDDVAVKVAEDDRFNRFEDVEERLSKGKTGLPSISPLALPARQIERRNSSLSMPTYVWDLLGDAAHKAKEPQNIFVMKALKATGLPIDDADLIDPRKIRNK
jgi:hypothetical protein